MRIKSATIMGFRSIREQTVEFDKLTAFVGKNGAGKSSVLQAVRLLTEPERVVDEYDFYGKYETGTRIEVKVTFTDLMPEELRRFAKYTKLGNLTVARRFDAPGRGSYFGYTEMVPEFAHVLAVENKTEQRRQFNELTASGRFEGLERATSAADVRTSIDAWQSTHPERCVPTEVGTQFYGFEGQYDLNNLTKFVFVPAVRDAADEISTGSLKSLMDTVVLRRINDNPRVLQFNQQFQVEAESIFKLGNFPELSRLADDLSMTLGRFSPGSKITIDWGKFAPPPLKPPAYDTNLVEDGYRAHPSKTGHGLQRAAIMTLLQHLHLFVQPVPRVGPVAEPSPEATPRIRMDLVLLIEEPELYLHPSRSRYLASLLLELTHSSGGNGCNQVLYSTHSPYFVGLDRFDQIRLMRKAPPGESGRPPTSLCTVFTRHDAGDRLSRTCDIPVGTDRGNAFMARCRPVVNSIVSEGFFASAVLVVEGATEQGVFSSLAERLRQKWDERGITVVPVGGKNNLDRPLIVFEGFGIPTYFAFDGDADCKAEKRTEVGEKNQKLQAELGGMQEPVAFPETFVGDKCSCFKMKIESYMQEELGTSLFLEMRDSVAADLGYSGDDKIRSVLKNVEAAASFIRKIYDRDLRLPKLEQIVEKVTSLACMPVRSN